MPEEKSEITLIWWVSYTRERPIPSIGIKNVKK